jgi:hypothetical protein
VPNLDFYAVGEDQTAVLNAMFDLGLFRVFETYSAPDAELREFDGPDEVPHDPHGPHLMLYAFGSGPEPTAHRIDLRPGALGDATFRYTCQGWGLIQLLLANLFEGTELRWSHTNHNTEKRAMKWADVTPDVGHPSEWDWPAMTRASNRLNRVIRSMAVGKRGSRPVLLQADQLISRAGLQFEYGMGIHARPSYGMSHQDGEAPELA